MKVVKLTSGKYAVRYNDDGMMSTSFATRAQATDFMVQLLREQAKSK